MTIRFSRLTPTLGVGSLDEAISFYTKLGFEVQWKWPEQNPTHASMKKDDIDFMISLVSNESEIQRGDLYFWVEDIQEYYHKLKESGIEIPDLVKTDYGMLDTSINDPWGHQLTFGEAHGDYEE